MLTTLTVTSYPTWLNVLLFFPLQKTVVDREIFEFPLRHAKLKKQKEFPQKYELLAITSYSTY